MAIGLGSTISISSEINVTPLIDVLLVLLIIFMILPNRFGERVDIPQKAKEIIKPEPEVVIHLGDNGLGNAPTIKINDVPVAWDSLETKLRDVYARKIERVAFLQGDPELDFQYVAQVVDMAHHAGFDHVGLLSARD